MPQNPQKSPLFWFSIIAGIIGIGAIVVFFVYITHTDLIKLGSPVSQNNDVWKSFSEVYNYLISPIIGIVGFIGIILTIMSQKSLTNKQITYQYITEMIGIYMNIRDEVSSSNQKKGVESFNYFLAEWDKIYKITIETIKNHNIEYKTEEIINISFLFFFFGCNEKSQSYLTHVSIAKQINDALAKEEYKDEYGKTHKKFKGHQDTLSHYFRFLYNAFAFIQSSNHLSPDERFRLGKLLRSSISNYELALLALNAKSTPGKKWETSNKISEFKLFRNIPEHFFSKKDMGFSIQELYPAMDFEWLPRPQTIHHP